MKRNVWITALVVLTIGGTLVFAQGKSNLPCGKIQGMLGGRKAGKGAWDGGRARMPGKGVKADMMYPMMKSMMTRAVVPTSDGGIIVVFGTRITKYDKNLNVVKEVESKPDIEAMREMMQKMTRTPPVTKPDKGQENKAPEKGAGEPAPGPQAQ